MSSKSLLACILFLTLFSQQSLADVNATDWDEEILSHCKKVTNISLPPEDRLQESEKMLFKGCNELSLYYGLEAPPAWRDALKCAQLNENNQILTALYANGYGVKRNPDVALHFACLESWPSSSFLMDLIEMKKEVIPEQPFDYCSGSWDFYQARRCAYFNIEISHAQVKQKVQGLAWKWSRQQQLSWQNLHQAAEQFINDHTSNEIEDCTDCFQRAQEDVTDFHNDLLQRLEKVTACEFTDSLPLDIAKADTLLNQHYAHLVKTSSSRFERPSLDELKQTERKWIRYRDAWIKFGRISCLNFPEQSFAASLTLDRDWQLRNLINPG